MVYRFFFWVGQLSGYFGGRAGHLFIAGVAFFAPFMMERVDYAWMVG